MGEVEVDGQGEQGSHADHQKHTAHDSGEVSGNPHLNHGQDYLQTGHLRTHLHHNVNKEDTLGGDVEELQQQVGDGDYGQQHRALHQLELFQLPRGVNRNEDGVGQGEQKTGAQDEAQETDGMGGDSPQPPVQHEVGFQHQREGDEQQDEE